MSARRVLIAGCGDLGSRLAARLVGAGDRVIALSRSGRVPAPGVCAVRADLTESGTLQVLSSAGMAGADGRGCAVLHALVFLPAPDRRDELAYRGLFIDGLRNLLDALPTPPARLLFVSSTAVYGEDDGSWVDERTEPRPAGFNGAILLEGERLAQQRHPGTVVARLAGLYGPGRSRMRQRAAAGEPGAPRWTNRIHVDDAAAALAHLLDLAEPAACYLVADGKPASEQAVLAWLRERTTGACLAPPTRGRRIDSGRLLASGWSPRHPDFRSGFGEDPQQDAVVSRPALL